MKSFLLLALSAVLMSACLLAGCAPAAVESGNAATTIAASFYPMYIMTRNVARDIPGVSVVCMTQPTTGCLHDYSLTTEDMKNLEKASILVINGAGMESFMEKVIGQFPDLALIESSHGIPLIEGHEDHEDHEDQEDHADHNHGEGEGNPHVWVSVSNAILQVRNIADELMRLDPAHAEQYQANADAYVKKLEALREQMHRELDGFQNRKIVTFHEAFPYFAREFNLEIVGVIEREPGSEPSARELTDTIAIIRDLSVKALFSEPQYPSSAAETIANETGLPVHLLDPAVTGPMEEDAYLNIMKSNLEVLLQALK